MPYFVKRTLFTNTNEFFSSFYSLCINWPVKFKINTTIRWPRVTQKYTVYVSSPLLTPFSQHWTQSLKRISVQTTWLLLQTAYSNTFSSLKYLDFKWYFIETCSLCFNWKYVCIDADNGFIPSRRLATVWYNDVSGDRCIYRWVSARTEIQCVSNGVTSLLH